MISPAARRSLWLSLKASFWPWLVSRVIVLGGLALAWVAVRRHWLHHPGASARVHQGLLGWDAAWYRSIALDGYASLGSQATRFFPGWPLLIRLLHATGLPVDVVMIGGASVLWLVALVASHQLGGALGLTTTARQATLWLLCLTPGVVSSVLGYAEPLLIALTTVALTLVFAGRTWSVPAGVRWMAIAVCGFAAGATRPVGVLLVIPLAIEGWRQRGSGARLLWPALAAVSPVVGLASYALWCRHQFSSALLPLRVQTEASHHGSLTDPVSGLVRALQMAAHGHGSVVAHLPWVCIALVLCVLAYWRLPTSLALYSSAIVLLALSGHNLDSFERYATAAPPLFMVAAGFLRAPKVRVALFGVLGVWLLATATLVFANAVVP